MKSTPQATRCCYSAAEIGELIAATNRICAAKGTPSITLLRVANG